MGWKVQYITQKEYDSLQTDMQKEEYISKVLAYMYMDAQFIERPKWVEPYPRQ
ncbi:hypothetical protein X943_002200 [Babesia divergens]|uniref:Uncharacterized protein n=1 Tax=Babesia divergens TaxID=32595 RepID=A0AAD9GAK9_BABDI|nr:hypothetical protein X943_002200 [Babesia divergens]